MENTDTIPHFDERPVDTTLENIIVNEEEIIKVVKELKTTKAQGPDNIHPYVVKECKEILTKPMCDIFNKSIQDKQLPNIWKTANVTAIYKAGKATLAENYRPISITPICCRILEKIIRTKSVQHLTSNNLISIYQHGFRQGYSCVTQLLESIDDWTEAIDNGEDVDIIYLDFKAAFDKVPYQRLLNKVKGYGIGGKVLSWLQDFLTNRKQRVLINGSLSTLKRCNKWCTPRKCVGSNIIPDLH